MDLHKEVNRETLYSLVYAFLLAISACFALLLVKPVDTSYDYYPSYSIPYLSVGIIFITISSLAVLAKQKKGLHDWVLYIQLLILSVCVFTRVNPFLTFLNIVGIIYLGTALLTYRKDKTDNPSGFLSVLFSPLTTFFEILLTRNVYTFNLRGLIKKAKGYDSNKVKEVALGILITLGILIVIIPLLSYSNPFFNRLVENILVLSKLKEILKEIFSQNILVHLMRFIYFLGFAFFLPRFASYINISPTLALNKQLELKQSLFIPKLVLSIVLGVFFITQAQLYFATDEVLAAMNFSNSQYAREIFAQLSIVMLIVFGLIYYDKGKSRGSKITTYILLFESFFLSLIALKSNFDYTSNWGFTSKRLYGYAVVIWILGLLCLFAYKYIRNLANAKFIQSLILFSGFVLIGINAANFDYLIYNYAKASTEKGIDHQYLSRLSTDSQSWAKHTEELMSIIAKDEPVEYEILSAAQSQLYQIEALNEEYQSFERRWRAFNLSKYMEYQKTKAIDTQYYLSIIDRKFQVQGSNPFVVNDTVPPEVFRNRPSPQLYQLESDQDAVQGNTPTMPYAPPQQLPPTQIETKSFQNPVLNTNNANEPLQVVTVIIKGLPSDLYDENVDVINKETGETTKTSLYKNSLIHSFGTGDFDMVIYEPYDENGEPKLRAVKTLEYSIAKDDVQIRIDYE